MKRDIAPIILISEERILFHLIFQRKKKLKNCLIKDIKIYMNFNENQNWTL